MTSPDANFEILVLLGLCFGVAVCLVMIIRPDMFIQFGSSMFLDLKDAEQQETYMLYRALGVLFLMAILGIGLSAISQTP